MDYFKKESVSSICLALNHMYRECSDARNDGWTAFGYKQELIKIQYHLQNLLSKCPTFAGEQEYIDTIEKTLTWDILKNDFR